MGVPPLVYAEQGSDALLVQLGADDAQTAGVVGRAAADLRCARNVVKVQPFAAVCRRNDALCAQNRAERNIAERGERCGELVLGVFVGRFLAPGGEYLVRVVVMIVAAAAVTVVVVMMVLVLMVVIVVMLMLVVMVMAAAGAVLAVLMMMVMLVIVMVMLVMMLMLLVVMVVLIMVMVMMLVMRLPSMVASSCSPVRSFHGVVTMRACSFRPRSMATVSSRRFSGHSAVRESRIAPACAT